MKLKTVDRWGNFVVADFERDSSYRIDEFSPLMGTAFQESFVKGEYENENCFIRNGDIVVDVGACIGIFTNFAAERGASQIFSFEADVPNFVCLVENAPKNCIPFNLGIRGSEGFSDFYLDANKGGHSFINDNTNNSKVGKTGKAYCVSLQSLFDSKVFEKIDFLKIDVEGSEKEILWSLPDKYFERIDRISMEWHNFIYKRDGSIDILLKRLSKWYDYTIKPIGNPPDALLMVYCWKKPKPLLESEEKKPIVVAHASYIGHTGFNEHTRNFFRALSTYIPVKIQNFTYIPDQSYLDELDHRLLLEQHWADSPWKAGTPYEFTSDEEIIDIVLAETNHFYYYGEYGDRRRIAYNVWESTLFPDFFFQRLLEYDQLWVPSNWQRNCAIKQGFPADRVKVVPEGVDGTVFHPLETWEEGLLPEYEDKRFKFVMFGRWDNRKSTTEIVQTFLKTFGKDEPVDLVVSIDNPFPEKWQKGKTTEECLKELGLDDPRVHVKHFPSRADYVSYLQHGHVFVSCARSEGWNLPLIEAIACGIPTISSNYGAQLDFAEGVSHMVNIKEMRPIKEMFMYDSPPPGEFSEPDFDHLSEVMRDVYENYEEYKAQAATDAYKVIEKFTWENAGKIANELLKALPERIKIDPSETVQMNYHFVNAPFVEITGRSKRNFKVRFIDKKENKEVYGLSMQSNHWARCSRKWYTDWKIVVEAEGKPFFTHDMNLKDERVLINMDSKAIGDTIAWFPYLEEFRKKHNCKLIASTFWNKFFRSSYPSIEFVEPGTKVDNLYAQYVISYQFDWDADISPAPPKSVPLQKVATNILGLDFEEIKPRIEVPKKDYLWEGFRKDMEKFGGKYVCISEHSTAMCKYWNNQEEGWQSLVDYLKQLGYSVVVVGNGASHLKNVFKRTNLNSIEKTLCYIAYSDLFIGLSAGLTWVAWAVNTPTIMISGCTPKYNEFVGEEGKNIRIINEDVCHGCMNDPDYVFDKGDWHWCPAGKNFECTRKITAKMISQAIDKIILG